jgi:uncharacterized protein
MRQTPCEYIVWHGLPVLRKEVAKSMISNFDLCQKEAAQKLGLTPSAVSQYISGKRGRFDIIDNELLLEIKQSAKRIIEEGDDIIVSEICRLCKICINKKIFQDFCLSCEEMSDNKID